MAEPSSDADRPVEDLVREKHAQLKSGDYFALLGVPRTADLAEVKNAYFSLAKVLHPDAIARQQLTDLARPAVEVFKGLTDAYAVLSDRRRRLEYEATLQAGGQAAKEQDKVQRDAASEARIWYHKGTLLLQRRAHAEAETCFRKAIELDPMNRKLLTGLGWAVMNNEAKPMEPRLEEARQWFQRALDFENEDPTGDPFYYMALYHKARGDANKQRSFLSQCLAANPKHVDALREQRLLALRSRRKAPESPILLGIQKLIDRFQQGSKKK